MSLPNATFWGDILPGGPGGVQAVPGIDMGTFNSIQWKQGLWGGAWEKCHKDGSNNYAWVVF